LLHKATGCKYSRNQFQNATGFKKKFINMENYRSHCPINLGLEVFGDKWTLLIIRDIMFGGKRHFGELRMSEEKIASNVLADRLSMLEEEGIISKSADPEHKQKLIYSLTEKGIDLVSIIKEVGTWSFKYKPVDEDANQHAKMLAECGVEGVELVKQQLRKEHLVK
jgi:DNA-binding HxlR family transcriptional regulator